jgi:hypothetical protein
MDGKDVTGLSDDDILKVARDEIGKDLVSAFLRYKQNSWVLSVPDRRRAIEAGASDGQPRPGLCRSGH